MILRYSGADKSGNPQTLPEKSLGGFISSSAIPNALLGNLFSSIGRSDVQLNRIDTRLIVLTNTTGADVTGVSIYVNPDPVNVLSVIKIAVVAPAFDEPCNAYYFENLVSPESLPIQAVLAVRDSGNPVNVGTIQSGKSVGIWLSRELDPDKFPLLTQPSSCSDEYIALLEADQAGNGIPLDQCNLVVNWA